MAARRQRLAQRRKTVGFTQEALAEQLGVDATTVRRWESGETENGPQPWLRPLLARCLKVSVEQLEWLLHETITGDSPEGPRGTNSGTSGADLTVGGALGPRWREQLRRGLHDVVTGAAATGAEVQSGEAASAEAYTETRNPTREPGTPSEAQNGARLALPTGQEVLGTLISAIGAELAGGLAAPLLYLAFLSTPAQAAPTQWSDQLQEQLRTFLHEWADTMDRRELLRLLGYAATTVAAFPVSDLDSDEQERFVKAIAAPSRVDTTVISHIETMLQHCKRQEDVLGPHAVLHTVMAQRELVHSLLDDCPTELHPRLLSVYSSMSSSVGIYFFDLADPASAMHYCDQARAAAQEARNTELAIYALCMMSHFASQQEKTHAAIDFAAAAQSKHSAGVRWCCPP